MNRTHNTKRIISSFLVIHRKQAHLTLLLLCLLLILFFTFVIKETFEFRTTASRGVCLTPFREFVAMIKQPNHSFYFWQIVLNIILFIPFGFTLSTYLNCRKRSPYLFLSVLLTSFFLSTSVELLQYLTSRGYTEVDDVINNTVGAVIGWWGYERALKGRSG